MSYGVLQHLFDSLAAVASNPVTSAPSEGVTPEAAPMLDRTPVTPVTLSNEDIGLQAVRAYRPSKFEGDAAHAESWDDAACARFSARMGQFIARRIDVSDAIDLAERLHLRDVQADDRRACVECVHLAGRASIGWRCGNARAAGLASELPAELVTMAQRCPGFAS